MSSIYHKSFIIHTRNYGETSIILEVLTEENGLITLLGKGVKKKKDFPLLQPFRELKLFFSEKKNFPILGKYEPNKDYKILKNNYLLHGMYLNELIHKFIPHHEPCISLYNLYKQQLSNMSETIQNINIEILKFEISFLKEIGYELTLANLNTKDINHKKSYCYDYEIGFREVRDRLDLVNSVSGENLLLLLNNQIESISNISNVRVTIKNIFQRLSGGKKIKSYEIFD
ncbi:MAG: DNA repair protein RecO [Pseudomonadota bacterium]|nr:DNA repair protein RecO [Pseudomonadota bacterium]